MRTATRESRGCLLSFAGLCRFFGLALPRCSRIVTPAAQGNHGLQVGSEHVAIYPPVAALFGGANPALASQSPHVLRMIPRLLRSFLDSDPLWQVCPLPTCSTSLQPKRRTIPLPGSLWSRRRTQPSACNNMPPRGLEPPRPCEHRSSTCRVCQFRHGGD